MEEEEEKEKEKVSEEREKELGRLVSGPERGRESLRARRFLRCKEGGST